VERVAVAPAGQPVLVAEALVRLVDPGHAECGDVDPGDAERGLLTDGEVRQSPDREGVGQRRRRDVHVDTAVEVGP
jgi:hypothetical protein